MATYKVLQDIEAEDTLVGPLTLRQCIYAAIALLSGWLCFMCIKSGAVFLVIPLLPFVAFGVFFAIPWSKQQPTEVWALAKLRFYFKPRKRIWNQTGTKQLVTITVPKVVRMIRTKNLTPFEVQHRMRALADTIDSRGWAIKNIELGYYNKTAATISGSDRLIDPSSMPQDVPTLDDEATTDIFDTANNPIAHKFDIMMAQSAGEHHEQLMQQMAQPAADPASITNYWHMRTIQPPADDQAAPQSQLAQPASQPVTDDTTAINGYDDATAQAMRYYYKSIGQERPASSQPAGTNVISVTQPVSATSQQTVTTAVNPAILELVNNDDLNVATIAREAKARTAESQNGEVVVDLHS